LSIVYIQKHDGELEMIQGFTVLDEIFYSDLVDNS